MLTAGYIGWTLVPFIGAMLRIDGAVQWLILGLFLSLFSGLALLFWAFFALRTDPWLDRAERKRLSRTLGLGGWLPGIGLNPIHAWRYLRDRVYDRNTRHWLERVII